MLSRFPFPILSAAFLVLALSAAGCTEKTDSDPEVIRGDSVGTLAPADSAQPDTMALIDTAQPALTHIAEMTTSEGTIVLGLYGQDAPKTVKNFVELAKKGFYDGIGFHRIDPGFVIQTGDPLSKDTTKRRLWGTGGESIYGGEFEDELNPESRSGRIGYVSGTLAMANRGPNTNTSQFFIVLTTEGARHLPYQFTIFGRVLEGMDVAHKIESTATVNDMEVRMPPNPATITGVVVKDVPTIE